VTALRLALLAVLGVLLASPARAAVIEVPPGQRVQAAIDAAAEGDTVQLSAAVFAERVVVGKRVTLRGLPGAVLDGGGEGTVITVRAADAVVEDLAIRNGGRDLGAPDCAVYVAKSASRAILRRLNIKTQGFGIWLHENHGGQVLDSRIEGSRQGNRPDRGNGIQLFDGAKLLVHGNTVVGGRDGIFVEATDDSVVEDNHFEHTRYAIHYMYSYRNTVRRNVARHNLGGVLLMFSHDIEAIDNLAEDNTETGLFLRDVIGTKLRGNRALRNGVGLFFYSCTFNELTGNLVRDNGIGVKLWGGSIDNRVADNAFVGNATTVFYVASRDLVLGKDAPGNYYSDYFGWDQNADGIGDRPYRVDTFTTRLVHQFPSAVLLLRSPALELLAHLEQRMPLLRVPTVIDQRPRVSYGPSP
jgi:nitrous oxidase accessory protein